MVVLAQKWAEAYMADNPGTSVQVTGGGSGTGIAALLDGTTDVADCSRAMSAVEEAKFISLHNVRPMQVKTAMDGLAIYVNAGNPLRDISLEQLEKIFTGKARNWKEMGGADLPIVCYSRENSSGTYGYFKEHVLKNGDFLPEAQAMNGTAALIVAVANDPKGIGYGGIGYAKGVRVLPVKADAGSSPVEPSMENVIAGTYPISRYLYCYLNPTGVGHETTKYLKFILGEKGQALVAQVGYYPLPKPLLARTNSAVDALAGAPTQVAVANAPAESPIAAPAVAATGAGSPAVTVDSGVVAREAALAQREAQVAQREVGVMQREVAVARRESAQVLVEHPRRTAQALTR